MDKIDINAIIHKFDGIDGNVRMVAIEAIHQALVLASENAIANWRIIDPQKNGGIQTTNAVLIVDKQSILDIEELII